MSVRKGASAPTPIPSPSRENNHSESHVKGQCGDFPRIPRRRSQCKCENTKSEGSYGNHRRVQSSNRAVLILLSSVEVVEAENGCGSTELRECLTQFYSQQRKGIETWAKLRQGDVCDDQSNQKKIVLTRDCCLFIRYVRSRPEPSKKSKICN